MQIRHSCNPPSKNPGYGPVYIYIYIAAVLLPKVSVAQVMAMQNVCALVMMCTSPWELYNALGKTNFQEHLCTFELFIQNRKSSLVTTLLFWVMIVFICLCPYAELWIHKAGSQCNHTSVWVYQKWRQWSLRHTDLREVLLIQTITIHLQYHFEHM